jgi:hypothetical protein
VAESSSDFRNALLEVIDTSPDPMDHPSPDRWIAYHRGQLSGDEETQLQEHLARCRDCFDLSAGAAAFAQPDGEPGADLDAEAAAQWRLLRAQLGPAPDPALHNVRAISASPRWTSRGVRLLWAVAALFFVALVSLGAWNLRLQKALAPQPNAVIAELSAGERVSTAPAAERILSASTGMLVVHPAEDLPAYRLTLRDAATRRELWSFELRPDEDSALTVQLPAGLQPGHYRLELSDGAGGRAGRILQTYFLRVP